jgi:hypothetical protein
MLLVFIHHLFDAQIKLQTATELTILSEIEIQKAYLMTTHDYSFCTVIAL